MEPDPARSRVEARTRLAACSDGFSLVEALVVVAMLATVAGIAVPLLSSSLNALRAGGAARYLSGRLNLARSEAVKRSVHVALRIEGRDTGYRYAFYADGNGDGVRTRDIARGLDYQIMAPERIDEKFGGVTFGILDGVTPIDDSEPLPAGSDPVRFGRSDILSFSPLGSSTAGTLYLQGRGRQQMAVRVLGVTGRVRVLRFDFSSRKWTLP